MFSLGFWCQVDKFNILADHRNNLYGIVIGGVIRALCGLCFGVIAWLIYNKLFYMVRKKSQMVLLTVMEALAWGIFFTAWFIFALVVLMVHTHGLRPQNTNYLFCGGYIAVEFFLILSGYFATKYILDSSDNNSAGANALKYTVRQVKKVVPAVVVTVFFNYAVIFAFGNIDLQDMPYMLYEMLLLPQSGIYKTFINLPLWYISAYVICLPVFLYLLGKFKDFFFNIGVIIVPLIIYGFICRNNVHLDIWNFSSGIPFVGLLRVFAGLCMGANCFRMVHIFKKIRFNIPIGLAMLGAVLAYCMFFQKTYADYFLVLLMMLALAAILSAREEKACSGNKVLLFLGKWSMYLYMSYWLIRYIVPKVFLQMSYYELLPIYIAASLLWALVVMLICRILNFVICRVKGKVI